MKKLEESQIDSIPHCITQFINFIPEKNFINQINFIWNS